MGEPNFEELLTALKAQGMSHGDALKKIHKMHPGLRRRWERSQESSRKGASGSLTPQQGAALLAAHVAERGATGGDPPRDAEPDYFELLDETKRKRGCSTSEAALWVQKKFPQAWRAMIRKANPDKSEKQIFGE